MPEKLEMCSPDLVADNIARIAELFPSCITEAAGDNGQVIRKVDFDLLRQELSDEIVEGPLERYHLNWPGKREATLAANTPIAKTLCPCREESVNFDRTGNLFIEGDNLDALKLLQETYLGKVKMIYIDPPYNTGNDFVYDDNFSVSAKDYLVASHQENEREHRLVLNTEANGRIHSDWLSMVFPRLRLAKNLLAHDGAVVISIDDNEVHQLRKMCDEIFGESNFVAEFVWKCRQFTDSRATSRVSTDHEYLVCYSRTGNLAFRGNPRDESKYKNPDSDPRGPWMSRSILGLATEDQRPNLHYTIKDPNDGRSFDPPSNTGWRYGKTRMTDLIDQGCILFPSSATGRPREKKFRADLQNEFTSFPTVIDDVFTSSGTAEVRELFGEQVFDFPKPTAIIEKFVEQLTDDGDIVLDMSAGSCSGADAIFRLNSKSGKHRRVISLQLPEAIDEESNARKAGFQTISTLGIERQKRAGSCINRDRLPSEAVNVGFRVFKIASSNMKDVYYEPAETSQAMLGGLVDNIKESRTGEDLLFQVLLDCGVDLGLPIRCEKIDDRELFFVNDSEHASPDLIACFDSDVPESLVKTIAGRTPLRAVFRDHCFTADDAKINVEQIFKQMSPQTQLKSL